MKLQLIALFGLLLTTAPSFPQDDKTGIFTTAISEAYRARDAKAIMAFYYTDGVSQDEIKKEQERWETMLNKFPVAGASFQNVVFIPIATIKQWGEQDQPRLANLQGLAKENTLKAIETQQKCYADLTQPIKRDGIIYVYNLPVAGLIEMQYAVESKTIGGFAVPVSFDTDGALRFPVLIPAASQPTQRLSRGLLKQTQDD